MSRWKPQEIVACCAFILTILACYELDKVPPPNADSVASGCGSYAFLIYEPKELASLQDLPERIRTDLVAHLQSRLGKPFYSRLRFRGGYVYNINELYRVEPETRQYPWKVPSYNLHFGLPMSDEGLNEYCAQIDLDAEGKVMKEIALPPISAQPEKSRVVPVQEALRVAGEHGVPVQDARVELGYDLSQESLVWMVSYTPEFTDTEFTRLVLHVNAHTGKFAGWVQMEGHV